MAQECVTQTDALRGERRDLGTQLSEQADDVDLTGGTMFVGTSKEAGCSQPTSISGLTAPLVTPDLVQQLAAQLVLMVSQAVITALTAKPTAIPTANLLTLQNKSPPALVVTQQRHPPAKRAASPREISPRPRSLVTPLAPLKHRVLKHGAEEGDIDEDATPL